MLFNIACLPKVIPVETHYRPRGGWGSKTFEKSVHEGGKGVSPTQWPPGTHFWWGWIDHSATGRIILFQWKTPTIESGNPTRDLPACSAVPEPTSPPGAPPRVCLLILIEMFFSLRFIPLYVRTRRYMTRRAVAEINWDGSRELIFTSCKKVRTWLVT